VPENESANQSRPRETKKELRDSRTDQEEGAADQEKEL
jgi:hypothetical protein